MNNNKERIKELSEMIGKKCVDLSQGDAALSRSISLLAGLQWLWDFPLPFSVNYSVQY